MTKRALITGITGQDGSYLSELLLEKGYDVTGVVRRSATPNYWRIEHILPAVQLIEGDLTDELSLARAVDQAKPDEIYNLAAQSHVGTSFEQPYLTMAVNGIGVRRFLEIVRTHAPESRFYQASTSELFGEVRDTPQNESTPFNPVSPYGHAKLVAHYAVREYRETKGLFACSGILFNHESPRRGDNFVTKKITNAVKAIYEGRQDTLSLGNLDAIRDWGYAKDYVEAMWLMLQQDKPDDFVISSGEAHSVKDFCSEAFSSVGLDWGKYIKIDPSLFRPVEVTMLRGDSRKANKVLGWYPKTPFKQLVKDMVGIDIDKKE